MSEATQPTEQQRQKQARELVDEWRFIQVGSMDQSLRFIDTEPLVNAIATALREAGAESNLSINVSAQMDWQQVALNGGPPCFTLLDDEDGYYCGRAQRWEGHDGEHPFVSLESLIAAAEQRGMALGIEMAARQCEANYEPTDKPLRSYHGGLNEAARRYAREIRASSPIPNYAANLVAQERERIRAVIQSLPFPKMADVLTAIQGE